MKWGAAQLQTLHRMYVIDGCTPRVIAKHFKTSSKEISRRLYYLKQEGYLCGDFWENAHLREWKTPTITEENGVCVKCYRTAYAEGVPPVRTVL